MMIEKAVVILIVGIAILLGMRSFLRTLSGKNEGWSRVNSGSCPNSGTCGENAKDK